MKNKILKRQLKRLELEGFDSLTPEKWERFLESVERSYKEFEEGRYLLERSLEISSNEMREEIDRNKKMSLQLAHAGKMASLGTLASGVAHELNNPLAGIKGHAELMEMRGDHPKNAASVQAILRLTERMADTIKHMLKLSRSGKQEDNEKIFDVAQPIKDSWELFQRQFLTENISVAVNVAENSHFVKGNLNTLTGVFQNLFSNSRDAFLSVENGAHRHIDVTLRETDGENISIVFSDNAGGISNDKLNKIFDPFYTTKDVGSGTGLGLSISRQVVEDMGGEIQVETRAGEGTDFVLCFPTFKNKVVPVGSLSGVDAKSFPLPTVRGQKILLVDDEEVICEFLEDVLGAHFEVTSTTDPENAIQLGQTNNYDLVITDLKMPEISGATVARSIREVRPDANIVFISGHMDGDRESWLSPHAPYLLIEKPFPKPDKLVKMVSEFVRSQERAV